MDCISALVVIAFLVVPLMMNVSLVPVVMLTLLYHLETGVIESVMERGIFTPVSIYVILLDGVL